jgi:hypothetical protein
MLGTRPDFRLVDDRLGPATAQSPDCSITAVPVPVTTVLAGTWELASVTS